MMPLLKVTLPVWHRPSSGAGAWYRSGDLKDSLIPAFGGMGQVGLLFEEGQVFVPELFGGFGDMVAARTMKARFGGVAVLRPGSETLASNGVKPAGKVLLGTVKGDLHDARRRRQEPGRAHV